MKLQYGKRYKTKNGGTTSPLVVNPNRTINYPFLDPSTRCEYTEDGIPYSGVELDYVIGCSYDMTESHNLTLEEQNRIMKEYIKEVVTQMQKLREVHTKHWNELPQSLKDYMAQ